MLGELELLVYRSVIYSILIVLFLLSRMTTGINSRVGELCGSAVDRKLQHVFCIPGSNPSGCIFNKLPSVRVWVSRVRGRL